MERSISDLRQRQSLPLGAKVSMTQRRILEWVPEDGLWKPDKNGLGMAHVFDELCKLYGRDFIRYK